MALPIILNSIDLQNKRSESKTVGDGRENGRGEVIRKRQQLRVYNEAMSLCHKRYTGTGQCLRYIDATIASARRDNNNSDESNGNKSEWYINYEGEMRNDISASALAKVTNEVTGGPGEGVGIWGGKAKMDDWFETFVTKPRQYLRIALTVDVWMACGKMAGSEDLPRVLLLDDSLATNNSVLGVGIPKSLGALDHGIKRTRVGMGGFVAEVVDGDRGWEMGKRRSDLDYFDFGSSSVNTVEVVADVLEGLSNDVGGVLDKNNEHQRVELPLELDVEVEGNDSVGSFENEGSFEQERENESSENDSMGNGMDNEDWNGVIVDQILEDVLVGAMDSTGSAEYV